MNASPLLKNSAAPAPLLGQVAAEAKAVAGVADSLKIEKAPGIPSATPSTSAGSAVSANGEVGAAHSHTSPPSDFIPAWAQDELFLTRTASIDGTSRKQGVWIDWPKLRSRLLENIADLLPGADLIPISPSATTTDPLALVTLPVRLAPGALPYSITAFSPMTRGLLIAWACLLAAAAAIAWVLFKSIQLSERRGAFVSAVTHELRTPLTTFRMYSEMLADDVVADPDTRRQYLQTLVNGTHPAYPPGRKRPQPLPHRAWPPPNEDRNPHLGGVMATNRPEAKESRHRVRPRCRPGSPRIGGNRDRPNRSQRG